MTKTKKLFGVLFFTLVCVGCVETFDFESEIESFESVLVVEATITNEFKNQRVLLSRTSALKGENGAIPEKEAVVIVKNKTSSFTFIESNPGEYRSIDPFSVEEHMEYHIEIKTSDGNMYSSKKMELPPVVPIENLYIERGYNENEDDGVLVLIDIANSTDKTQYYRYEYEETYKIIAPWYSPTELIPRDVQFPFRLSEVFPTLDEDLVIDYLVEIKLRDQQEQICYNTLKSNSIILTDSNSLVENELEQFKIHFVNRNNYIISHRYTVLVKQYVLSKETYSYYETLKNFSNSKSVLTEHQTGYIQGNLVSLTNSQEKVIGFFDVASVNEKRIFFNYSDLFPDEFRPPYAINCDDFFIPGLIVEDLDHNVISSPLIDALDAGYQFYIDNEEGFSIFESGPFILVLEPCGDCTVLGSNSVPEFWSE